MGGAVDQEIRIQFCESIIPQCKIIKPVQCTKCSEFNVGQHVAFQMKNFDGMYISENFWFDGAVSDMISSQTKINKTGESHKHTTLYGR